VFFINAVPTTTKTQTFLHEKVELEVSANAIPIKHGITLARALAESKHGLQIGILVGVCRVEVHAHSGTEHLCLLMSTA
jgi:hypothetical protein